MKYSIGYRLPCETDSMVKICRDYGKAISNVYFSFASEQSGRLPLCSPDDSSIVEEIQISELREIKKMGKTLTLLFNAACYGESAVSEKLKERVFALCDKMKEEVDLDGVTTTSPFIAEIIKERFGNSIKVMASVNMRIATVRAMEQLSEMFDGYYVAKECNRNFEMLKELHAWCKNHGKRISILANSGCLPFCAYQSFHDNLVAHETLSSVKDIDWSGLPSPCHRFISSKAQDEALGYFLSGTWIRPEDVGFYEPLFGEMKLATRMHMRARSVIAAYVRGRYPGNLLDLTEPSFSSDLRGAVIDNTLMPHNFFEHVTSCNKKCDECGYCTQTARNASIKIY
ncbi:MAG: hypothetical protein E7582_05010 [Ruminococcaceae bacterium]|nr:hypothetical protein [Oscillospiraceae bacterium]